MVNNHWGVFQERNTAGTVCLSELFAKKNVRLLLVTAVRMNYAVEV